MNIIIFSFTLLILTQYGSLASGQWESDKFLFNIPDQRTTPQKITPIDKPKANKQLNLPPKRSISSESQIPDYRLLPIQNQVLPDQTKSIVNHKHSLQLQFGYTDFRLNSRTSTSQFSKGSYAFAGGYSFIFSNNHVINYKEYIAPDTFHENLSNEMVKVSWHQYNLSYLMDLSKYYSGLKMGPIVRGHSWWYSSSKQSLSFRPTVALGLVGQIEMNREGRWKPLIECSFLPVISEIQGQPLKAKSIEIDWKTFLEFKSNQEFLLSIGYESLTINETVRFNPAINQGILKMLLGYQIHFGSNNIK